MRKRLSRVPLCNVLLIPCLTVGLTLCLTDCGKKNKLACTSSTPPSSHCPAKTADEVSVELLNAGDYEAAVNLLEQLIRENGDSEPEKLYRRVRLASAYAALAGYDVFAIIESLSKNESTILSTETAITEESLGSLEAELKYLSSALDALKVVFTSLPYPTADDSEAFKKKYFFLSSGQFQQSIYTAIQINQCNAIYAYIAASPLERRALLGGYPACGFSQTMENLSTFISSFSDLAQTCEKCKGALETFKAKKSDYEESLKGLEQAQESEKINKIISDTCLKKKQDPALCQIQL